MRQGFAMKKRILIRLGIVVLICIGIASFFFPWRWFSLAGDVVNETLMAANEGRYAEASQNLSEIRRSYQTGPSQEKALWDSITRNGTISKVVVLDETKSVRLGSADVSIEIHYRDGSVIHTNEGCYFEDGRWKLSLGLIIDAVHEEQARKTKQEKEKARAIPLDDQHTRVDGTGVAVRLPKGCQWDKAEEWYTHPRVAFVLTVKHYPGLPLQSAFDFAFHHRHKGGKVLLGQQEVAVGKFRGELWTSKIEIEQGRPWRQMALILGNHQESVVVTGQCLWDDESGATFTRECLLSTEWNPQLDPDFATKIPFTIVPSKEFALQLYETKPAGLIYTQADQKRFDPANARFTITARAPFPELKNKRMAFEQWLAMVGKNFPKFSVEKIQPITVGSLDGFEAFVTAFQDEYPKEMFHYAMLLFKSDVQVYILVGVVPLSKRAHFEPQFMQMARSFNLK
jgi:hypothetical protein